MTHPVLENRPMSGFPVSIGTSLALETLFTPTISVADESRIVEKVDPQSYDLFLVNTGTILRNLIQSVAWRDLATVAPKEVTEVFLEEIDFLTNFFQSAGLGIQFYWNSYSYPLKTYKDRIRNPTTEQQHRIHSLTEYVLAAVKRQNDVLTFSKDLSVDRLSKTLLLSHVPWDLLSYGNFHKLDLLESHTGRVKTRKDWNTKYFPIKDKDFSFLPFMEYLLVKFGDHVMFTPDPLKDRLELWEVMRKKKVHPLMSEMSVGFMLGGK